MLKGRPSLGPRQLIITFQKKVVVGDRHFWWSAPDIGDAFATINFSKMGTDGKNVLVHLKCTGGSSAGGVPEFTTAGGRNEIHTFPSFLTDQQMDRQHLKIQRSGCSGSPNNRRNRIVPHDDDDVPRIGLLLCGVESWPRTIKELIASEASGIPLAIGIVALSETPGRCRSGVLPIEQKRYRKCGEFHLTTLQKVLGHRGGLLFITYADLCFVAR